jgi:site-specific DNA-methyltransferase (adenine-specific)
MPKDLGSARELAMGKPDGGYRFRCWACSLVGARPVGETKEGAYGGIDGVMRFGDGDKKDKKIVVTVKGGDLGDPMVGELRGAVEREGAAIGLLVTLSEPTSRMLAEAAEAGFYESPGGGRHARIQILWVGALLDGIGPDLPRDCAWGEVTPKGNRPAMRGPRSPRLF